MTSILKQSSQNKQAETTEWLQMFNKLTKRRSQYINKGNTHTHTRRNQHNPDPSAGRLKTSQASIPFKCKVGITTNKAFQRENMCSVGKVFTQVI